METMPTGEERTAGYGIDLYGLPLGAGGWFVRMNGRIYEAVMARREHRPPCDLYHSALEVRVPEGRFVIENAWPIPDRDGDARGVVVEGPVGSPGLGHLRTFRYEIRRWRDGRIPDIAYAVASPQCVSSDPDRARLLLSLVSSVPALRWGRDELGIGDMWNSNSTVSWLLTSSVLLGMRCDRREEVESQAGGPALRSRRRQCPSGPTSGSSTFGCTDHLAREASPTGRPNTVGPNQLNTSSTGEEPFDWTGTAVGSSGKRR